jgi:hypothetical protein
MTREELTNEIYKKLVEIKEMYTKEYPKGNYLTLTIIDGTIMFNNERWDDGEDKEYPIEFYKSELPDEVDANE